MALTKEQFSELRAKGLTTDQIINFERGKKPATTTPEAAPKQQGVFQSIVQGVAKLPLRVASSVAPAIEAIQGKSMDEIQRRNVEGRDFGYFGQDVKPLGYQASDPTQSLPKAAVGMARDMGGAVLEGGSYLVGGGGAAQGVKAGLAGTVGRGLLQGAKAGAIGGAAYGAGTSMQDPNASAGDIVSETLKTAALGGVTGGVAGAVLPLPVAGARTAKELLKPSRIMQRVARINAKDQETFARAAGKPVGDYLVERGIYGNDDQITVQLAQRFKQSKDEVDKALSQLQGSFKNGAVDDALQELIEREVRVSTKNVPSQDLNRVKALFEKNQTQGLTMSEINEAKRIYERNVRLGYLKDRNTEAVTRATNVDGAIREWQVQQAEKLGFTNLRELNKETQLAKMLGDSLYRKLRRSEGNNAFGLTDAILISGGDPQAITMLLTKRGIGNKSVQSAIAKTLAPKPTVGAPKANVGLPTNQGSSKQSIPQSVPVQKLESSSLTLPPQKPRASGSSGQAFAGGAAGIQKDENGDMTFDPKSAALGILGVAAAKKAIKLPPSQIRPDVLAKRINAKELALVRDYLKTKGTGQGFGKVQTFFEITGMENKTEAEQRRFLQEIVNEYDRMNTRWIKPTNEK